MFKIPYVYKSNLIVLISNSQFKYASALSLIISSHKISTCNYKFYLVIDNCISQPCLNGGTCSNGVNTYTCNCIAGYTSHNCLAGSAEYFYNNNITVVN